MNASYSNNFFFGVSKTPLLMCAAIPWALRTRAAIPWVIYAHTDFAHGRFEPIERPLSLAFQTTLESSSFPLSKISQHTQHTVSLSLIFFLFIWSWGLLMGLINVWSRSCHWRVLKYLTFGLYLGRGSTAQIFAWEGTELSLRAVI